MKKMLGVLLACILVLSSAVSSSAKGRAKIVGDYNKDGLSAEWIEIMNSAADDEKISVLVWLNVPEAESYDRSNKEVEISEPLQTITTEEFAAFKASIVLEAEGKTTLGASTYTAPILTDSERQIIRQRQAAQRSAKNSYNANMKRIVSEKTSEVSTSLLNDMNVTYRGKYVPNIYVNLTKSQISKLVKASDISCIDSMPQDELETYSQADISISNMEIDDVHTNDLKGYGINIGMIELAYATNAIRVRNPKDDEAADADRTHANCVNYTLSTACS